MPKLLDYADIATQPTQRVPVVGTLPAVFAPEVRAAMHSGESYSDFFLRLWLFYRHHARQDSDTQLMEAYGRAEAR